ncbi:hypothetical protein F5883DRAFT_653764 [Diaporthe sp. PMI_573]|nr:hypothetical protein F5883DRAFT_653764 [Diaporthaceae sp. PMI_573]
MSRADPVSHWIHRLLRGMQFWKLSRRCRASGVEAQLALGRAGSFSHQNSASIANFVGRLIATLITGLFLIVPLAILSPRSPSHMQLIVVAVRILAFSFLVATMMKASNFEMMAGLASLATKYVEGEISHLMSYVVASKDLDNVGSDIVARMAVDQLRKAEHEFSRLAKSVEKIATDSIQSVAIIGPPAIERNMN